jgi:hypothetical protein
MSSEALLAFLALFFVAVALTIEAVDSRSDEFEQLWRSVGEAP